METQFVCPDAESRRLDHQAVLVRVLMGFIGQRSQNMDCGP